MRLPNRTKAYIPSAKLTGYLLSETHAVGRSKAKFFRALGFDESSVTLLEQELLAIAQTGRVKDLATSPEGTKYVMDGPMKTPKGVIVRLRTVWVIEAEQENPRFVTAYPIE